MVPWVQYILLERIKMERREGGKEGREGRRERERRADKEEKGKNLGLRA